MPGSRVRVPPLLFTSQSPMRGWARRASARGAIGSGATLDFAPMNLRRATRVFIALLLLHLTWVGNVSECADRGDHAASELSAHAGHGESAADHDHGAVPPQTDASIVDRCCAAMATCAVVLISTDGSSAGGAVDDG